MIDFENANSLTARCCEMMAADARLSVHEKGHTQKVRRHVGPRGPIAIELRKRAPTIWIEKELATQSPYCFSNTRVRDGGRVGRNSNLGAIFGDKDLLGIKPANDVDLLAAIGAVM